MVNNNTITLTAIPKKTTAYTTIVTTDKLSTTAYANLAKITLKTTLEKTVYWTGAKLSATPTKATFSSTIVTSVYSTTTATRAATPTAVMATVIPTKTSVVTAIATTDN